MKQLVFVIALIVLQVKGGPLAPGAWSAAGAACAAQCAPLIPGSPAYVACVAACWAVTGPLSSLLCFSEETTVVTPSGIKTMSQIEQD